MKATLVAILVTASIFVTNAAFAQNPALATAEAACGPSQMQFETETSKSQAPPQLEDGKSMVYVIEVFDKAPGQLSHPTLRVGIDGKWAGANKGDSYISFSVDPGDHHLCANWQSHWKQLSDKAAFVGFTADAGKTYYFRARIAEQGSRGGSSFSLDLEPVNGDEGKYLVASSALSVSHPKQ